MVQNKNSREKGEHREMVLAETVPDGNKRVARARTDLDDDALVDLFGGAVRKHDRADLHGRLLLCGERRGVGSFWEQ